MIIYVILCMIILILITIIGIILRSSKNKINNIINTTRDSLENIQISIPSLNGNERLKYTTDLISFIDNTINLEIINIRRFELLLGKKNKNLDVENVIEEVSMKVFKSLKPELFDDPNLIVTSDYLMTYIQKRTTISYIAYLNDNIAEEE